MGWLFCILFAMNDKFPLESFYVYEILYDIPEEAYKRYLDLKRSLDIENSLVESGSLVQKVVFQFGIPRIQDSAGLFHHMKCTYRYVE